MLDEYDDEVDDPVELLDVDVAVGSVFGVAVVDAIVCGLSLQGDFKYGHINGEYN